MPSNNFCEDCVEVIGRGEIELCDDCMENKPTSTILTKAKTGEFHEVDEKNCLSCMDYGPVNELGLCKKHYNLTTMKVCKSCRPKYREYCKTCREVSTTNDKNLECIHCSTGMDWIEDRNRGMRSGVCRKCGHSSPLNEEATCYECFIAEMATKQGLKPCTRCHAIIRKESTTCGRCGAHQSSNTCEDCWDFTEEKFCEKCKRSCRGCGNKFDPRDKLQTACHQCESIISDGRCIQCKTADRLDHMGRCSSCSTDKVTYCACCKVNPVKDINKPCKECNAYDNCPHCNGVKRIYQYRCNGQH